MTTDNDVKEAENSFLVKLFTALSDKRVLGAIIAAVLALCAYLVNRLESKPETLSSTGSVSTWICTGCTPNKPPSPPPSPVGTGGAKGTGGAAATGGSLATGGSVAAVVFPPCNPPTFAAPGPRQIEQLRRTLKPRHRIEGSIAPFGIVTSPATNVMWLSNDPFCGDQGSVGACVAFTAMDWATTKPANLSYATDKLFNSDSLTAYHWITANDPYPGTYPPNDTGSDTLTGCKYLVHMGYAKACNVLSGKSQVLEALKSGSIMSGKNWPDKWMSVNNCGRMPSVTAADVIDGGHDVLLVGYDLANDEEIYQNHWKNNWGVCVDAHCGYFRVKASDDFGSVIDSDFVQPVL